MNLQFSFDFTVKFSFGYGMNPVVMIEVIPHVSKNAKGWLILNFFNTFSSLICTSLTSYPT